MKSLYALALIGLLGFTAAPGCSQSTAETPAASSPSAPAETPAADEGSETRAEEATPAEGSGY